MNRDMRARDDILALMRRLGLDARWSEAALRLPDPVDLERDSALLSEVGLTLAAIVDDLGAAHGDGRQAVTMTQPHGSVAPPTHPANARDTTEHREAGAEHPAAEPHPAAVTFVTTEHFTLQGARASTVAEATGRATMLLGAVSGGLVALGLIGTAAGVHTAFYAFALILLPTLALLGLATFNRALQSGIEDFGYASRIARLRGYYFQYAPELVDYLTSVPPTQRLGLQGLESGRWQRFFTVSGMIALVTAVLAGAAAGLLAAVISDHVLAAALIAGVLVAVAAFAALIQVQAATWRRAAALPIDEA